MKHFPVGLAFTQAYTIILFLCAVCLAAVVNAQPRLTFTPITRDLQKPLEVENAGDGSGRLFIVDQTGRIAVFKDSSVLRRPFLDISTLITSNYLQGLYSLAFAPDYTTSRMFFIYYIDTSGNTIIARYRTSLNNPDVADPNSGVILFSWPGRNTGGPKFGDLHFGPDGYLYISVSDGSFFDATTTFAQIGNLPYGKILRIDVRVTNAPYYRIPPDNPFVNNPDVLDEIWAVGCRNAWRWSFDRGTNNMFIADDGNDAWEELNIITPAQSRGANFGWPCYEGNQAFDTTGCGRRNRYSFPAFVYPHDAVTGGFATIGGYVYRGTRYPQLSGRYIFSDFLSANAWIVTPVSLGSINTVLQSGIPANIAGYGEGEDGELYAASLDGIVYSIGIAASTGSITGTQQTDAIEKESKTVIRPTFVTGSKITLDLKEDYTLFSLFDVAGNKIMQQKISGIKGNISINLPLLNAGMYIVQLTGKKSFVQKIYVSK